MEKVLSLQALAIAAGDHNDLSAGSIASLGCDKENENVPQAE